METIDSLRLSDGTEISSSMYPSRASLTVNALVPVVHNGRVSLVYVNFDPTNWNQWYPPFTFHHCDVPPDLELSTRGLVTFLEQESQIAGHFRPDTLVHELQEECRRVLSLSKCLVGATPIVDREYWLKFSKSRKAWTLYCFLFFVCHELEPKSASMLLAIPNVTIADIEVTEYEGLAVVDNTVEILKQPIVRQALAEHAFALGQ